MTDTDLLAQLLDAARELTGPDIEDVESEYLRGQVELILDAAGLDGDDYRDRITAVLTHRESTQAAVALIAGREGPAAQEATHAGSRLAEANPGGTDYGPAHGGPPAGRAHPLLSAAADAENLIGGIADLLSPVRDFDFPDIGASDFPPDLTAAEQATMLRLLATTLSSAEACVAAVAGSGTAVAGRAGPLLERAAAQINGAWRTLEEVHAATGILPSDGPPAGAVVDFPAAAGPRPPSARAGAARVRAARAALSRLAGGPAGRRGLR